MFKKRPWKLRCIISWHLSLHCAICRQIIPFSCNFCRSIAKDTIKTRLLRISVKRSRAIALRNWLKSTKITLWRRISASVSMICLNQWRKLLLIKATLRRKKARDWTNFSKKKPHKWPRTKVKRVTSSKFPQSIPSKWAPTTPTINKVWKARTRTQRTKSISTPNSKQADKTSNSNMTFQLKYSLSLLLKAIAIRAPNLEKARIEARRRTTMRARSRNLSRNPSQRPSSSKPRK